METNLSAIAVGDYGLIGYEHSIPGPTLRVRPGDHLRILLRNGLSEPTNLHVHGLHVSPGRGADNVFGLVQAGEELVYAYDLPLDHPSCTNWYHPHPHGGTARQVGQGLAGAIIVAGELDELPGIANLAERVLVFQALSGSSEADAADVTRGPADVINGQPGPSFELRSGEPHRWRLINATSDVFYVLEWGGGPFHLIAMDGNPLPLRETARTLFLGPGERVDAIVVGETPGTYELRSHAFHQGFASFPERTLATIQVTGRHARRTRLPRRLIAQEDLRAQPVDERRDIVFGMRDPGPEFLIDQRTYDHHRVDQVAKLGALEEWTVHNATDEWHPFHIHVNPFQVIRVGNSHSKSVRYRDTIAVPPRSSATLRMRFKDFPGRFVYHCHILGHEDGGMMGIVEVRP